MSNHSNAFPIDVATTSFVMLLCFGSAVIAGSSTGADNVISKIPFANPPRPQL